MSDQSEEPIKDERPEAEEENGGEPEEVFLEEEAAAKVEAIETDGPDDKEEKLLRLMAEFENFRRRSAKEKAQERQRGRRDAAEKLLPVYDSIGAGLFALKPDDPARPGLEAVKNQLLTAFAQLGIQQVPAKGEPFDPETMEAILHQPHEEAEAEVVIEETRTGFLDDIGLLRPAQVIVSSGPAG